MRGDVELITICTNAYNTNMIAIEPNAMPERSRDHQNVSRSSTLSGFEGNGLFLSKVDNELQFVSVCLHDKT